MILKGSSKGTCQDRKFAILHGLVSIVAQVLESCEEKVVSIAAIKNKLQNICAPGAWPTFDERFELMIPVRILILHRCSVLVGHVDAQSWERGNPAHEYLHRSISQMHCESPKMGGHAPTYSL